MTTNDELRAFLEERFGEIDRKLDGLTKAATRAGDLTLELAPRIEKIEARLDEQDLRIRALEAGGTFEE